MKELVLVIGGSDSSGGAGIQADIKTVTVLGSYAMTAVTAVTSQNTSGLNSIVPISAKEISDQSNVQIYFIKDKNNLGRFIKQNIFGNKIVIGMGAGSISNWLKELPDVI